MRRKRLPCESVRRSQNLYTDSAVDLLARFNLFSCDQRSAIHNTEGRFQRLRMPDHNGYANRTVKLLRNNRSPFRRERQEYLVDRIWEHNMMIVGAQQGRRGVK